MITHELVELRFPATRGGKPERAALLRAQVAAAVQIHGADDEEGQLQAVRTLGAVPRPEATRELARMAVFAPQRAVREAALESLSVRRERDYAGVIEDALRYPWPTVAKHAAEAVVKLERKDLLPLLVDMLEGDDPRGPARDGTARELVRINHHRNCMMCHAPARAGEEADDVLVAEVPLPSEKLPDPSEGYGQSGSNLVVRIDVTYLRQDFSVMQAVDDSGPWPAMQRFDFVVRKRTLTTDEAADLRKRLTPGLPGVLSPYRKAAVSALREMTGRDLEAKAETWRKVLKREGS